MIGIGTESTGAVPDRGAEIATSAPRRPTAGLFAGGPVLILLAGLVLNVAWLALLGWTAFRVVHWLFA